MPTQRPKKEQSAAQQFQSMLFESGWKLIRAGTPDGPKTSMAVRFDVWARNGRTLVVQTYFDKEGQSEGFELLYPTSQSMTVDCAAEANAYAVGATVTVGGR